MLKQNNYLFLMETFCVQMVELSCIVHIPYSIFGEYIFWGLGWGVGFFSIFPCSFHSIYMYCHIPFNFWVEYIFLFSSFFHFSMFFSIPFMCIVISNFIFWVSTFSLFISIWSSSVTASAFFLSNFRFCSALPWHF